MKVQIYNIDCIYDDLKNNKIDSESAIVSFSDFNEEEIDFKSYHSNLDYIYIHFSDIDYCDYPKDELLDMFTELYDLVAFIKSRVAQGKNFICQCYEGHSRSAAVAAAILEHYEHKGSLIFNDRHYEPNQFIYDVLIDSL